MIHSEKQGFLQLLKISFPYLLISFIYTGLVLYLEESRGDHIYTISGQIGSVFGLAVAFFLGFRMNSAYDRWWEARKTFGELTNNTRSFVTKMYVYFKNPRNIVIQDPATIKKLLDDLIRLCIAYIHQFKNELHLRPKPILDAESSELFTKYNINKENKLSNEILVALTDLIEKHFSEHSSLEKNDLMLHINRFYDIQGKAERIRNTPFLKIYSAFTKIIVGFYVVLIPLFVGDIDLGGENSPYELLAIPIMMIISTAFLTINKLANLYGEPFADNKTSIAIDDICAQIESNCLEIKGKL